MSHVSANDPKKLRERLANALEDGRVTQCEARQIKKLAKRDGVTQEEQQLLHRALTQRNDLFEPKAQHQLSEVANFTPGENIAPNAPEQVRAEIRRALYDGRVNLTEGQRIERRISRGGVTLEERQMLLRQLDRHGDAFHPQVKANLEQLLRDTEPVLPGLQVQHAGGLEIRGDGVRPSAINEAARLAGEMTAHRPDIAARLAAAGHVVLIIPKDGKLTDLPEFASLQGTLTFDGRPWEEIRGVANHRGPDGRYYTAIAEENLSDLSVDGYGNGSVGIHELAHVIHRFGLPPEEQQEIKAAFDAAVARGGPFSSDYGANNEREYFAELAGTYFSRVQASEAGQTAEWIRQNDPAAYALLERIFGPPRNL
ncbi:MAG: hypothetical protein M3Y59_17215 [Myxococcota bacterium]|nr:hypothetical protein [Myxococcota bacterium]